MASFTIPPPLTTLSAAAVPSTAFPVKHRHFPAIKNPSRCSKISCISTDNDQESPPPRLDRRNVLIGLYGAAAASPFALAAPIPPPDVKKCHSAKLPSDPIPPTNCCPPLPPTEEVTDFSLPPQNFKLRVRPAAHLVDQRYIENFSMGIERMRALPDHHPHSLQQQANVHCAYCNYAYSQGDFPDLNINVHGSWLFFPFHRCYLYFFERILAKYVPEPANFGIPFWNWDAAEGMILPWMYTKPNSSLYDPRRNRKHQPPTAVDLNFNGCDPCTSATEQIKLNYNTMYRQMVSKPKTAKLFFGNPYRLGQKSNPGAGSIENVPHNTVHDWTGDPNQKNGEDMGTFYSAGRDPIFYAHHANVDRMWSVWKSLRIRNRDINDPDYLNTGFIFYDENEQLVRIRVRDCLDHTRLGYDYENVDIPWKESRPQPRISPELRKGMKLGRARDVGDMRSPEEVFPTKLNSVLKVRVKRPKTNRSKEEKDELEEILVIEGIELDGNVRAKFDVSINDDDEEISTPAHTEFAGSFVNLPHLHKHGENMIKTQLRLSITDILEDLEAEDDEYVLVTLVPVRAGSSITIDDVKIELDD